METTFSKDSSGEMLKYVSHSDDMTVPVNG